MIGPAFDCGAEAIGEELLGEDQADKQPNQQAGDEFAHFTLHRRFPGAIPEGNLSLQAGEIMLLAWGPVKGSCHQGNQGLALQDPVYRSTGKNGRFSI